MIDSHPPVTFRAFCDLSALDALPLSPILFLMGHVVCARPLEALSQFGSSIPMFAVKPRPLLDARQPRSPVS